MCKSAGETARQRGGEQDHSEQRSPEERAPLETAYPLPLAALLWFFCRQGLVRLRRRPRRRRPRSLVEILPGHGLGGRDALGNHHLLRLPMIICVAERSRGLGLWRSSRCHGLGKTFVVWRRRDVVVLIVATLAVVDLQRAIAIHDVESPP